MNYVYYIKKLNFKFLFFVPFICFFLFSFHIREVFAQDDCNKNCEVYSSDRDQYISCIQEKKVCYEGKIKDLQTQSSSLKTAIGLLNGKIYVQELNIKQTKAEIRKLEDEIQDLNNKMEGLNVSFEHLATLFITRVKESYKQLRINANVDQEILVLLNNSTSNEDISQDMSLAKAIDMEFLKRTQELAASEMEQSEFQRMTYDEQKKQKALKQKELEKKKQQLLALQSELDKQKKEKELFLQETKNNEQRYQKLLAEAEKQIASLKNFSENALEGGSLCLGSPAEQTEGWYFSQRDPRWCTKFIGFSHDTIGEVGCLVTSVSMVWTKLGHSITPAQIADNSAYFSLQTAYMKNPLPAPPGFSSYRYDRRGISAYSLIDEELSKGRPVIVHLRIGTLNGHFVVVKSGSMGNYTIFDPFFGANIPLSSHYSSAMIDSVRVFRPI